MVWTKSFVAGFLSTLLFHQGLLLAFYLGGIFSRAPYSLAPTAPFGVPQVVSLAFWGGLWGVVLLAYLRRRARSRRWLHALLFGALAPSLVFWLVVMPLKGMAVAGGGDPRIILGALVLNGVWGLGTLWLMRAMGR